MTTAKLTIGQLAAHVGVTVRAIRHYHQRGLLAEPERDESGYRRYGAQAVVDLIRIKALADAGVPLVRIGELVGADAVTFDAAVASIDRDLQLRARELEQHRRRLAQLGQGDRAFLPGGVVDLLDELRAMGVSDRTVDIERDAWILIHALAPQLVTGWLEVKSAALTDPDFRRLYLACDEALDLAPDDPALETLADEMVAYAARRDEVQPAPQWTADEARVLDLFAAHVADASPVWQRLNELAARRALPTDEGA